MKKITGFFLALLISSSVFALDIYDDLANAIRGNDAKQLSTFFGPTLDLTILTQEDVYSKAQAELILKDFFSKNICKTFNVLHKGSSPEGTQYAIGTMITTTGKNFRISFYIKQNQGKNILQELRIEAV